MYSYLINSGGDGGLMCEFDINLILNANDNSSVEPINKSKFEYYCFFENSFCILDDCSMLLGINNEWRNSLIYEELDMKCFQNVIAEIEEFIYTIIYSELYDCLFVGDRDENLVQYCMSTFRVLKQYVNIDIGLIQCSDIYKDLAVFGGSDNCFILVNIRKREIVSKPKETAIRMIRSLKFCKVGNKLLLYVSGNGSKYSNNKSDIFEIVTKNEFNPN